MDVPKNTVFISSSMQEMPEERQAIVSLLAGDKYFESYAFENDAGARICPPQEVWAETLEDVFACIAMFSHKVGEYTVDEIKIVEGLGKPLLVYARRDASTGRVDPTVRTFLQKYSHPINGKLSPAYFTDAAALVESVERDLGQLIRDLGQHYERAQANRVSGSGRTAVETGSGHGLEATEAPPANTSRRVDGVNTLSRNAGAFVGREETKFALGRLLGRQTAIVLVGSAGMGKRAVLRNLVHAETDADDFEHGIGVHPVTATGADTEDILQAIWDQFFVAEDNTRVNPAAREDDLKGVKAQVILTNVDLQPDTLDELTDTMAASTVLITTCSPHNVGGRPILVEPMTDDEELVALFEDRYAAEIPTTARDAIVGICHAVDGHPGLIWLLGERSFREVRTTGKEPDDGAHPLTVWAQERAAMAPAELLASLMSEETQVAVDTAQEKSSGQ